MDLRGTMVPRLILFVTAVLLSDAASQKREAYFNGTAFLPCQFENSQNISRAELVLFWQDHNKLVLYELNLGREIPKNVNAKYLGRTSFDQESWTLRLHNVRIQDQGLYECFIQHMGPRGRIILDHKNSELSVLANFSEPEIVPVSNITRNSGINLTCSSRQGYPKPKKMYFLLKTHNSTTNYSSEMQISQDSVTKLYTVSVSLSIPYPNGASNVAITCVLELEPNEKYLFSPPFYADPKDPVPIKNDSVTWIAAAITVSFIAALLAALLYFSRKQPPVVSHKGANTTSEVVSLSETHQNHQGRE